MLNVIMLTVVILSVIILSVAFSYRYAECRYAECHGTTYLSCGMLVAKEKKFYTIGTRAASNIGHKSIDQNQNQNGSGPDPEILDAGDSNDSGGRASPLPVFTTIDSLPPNRVSSILTLI
jgi:hypothetical protein